MKIIIGTKNQTKVDIVVSVFKKMFEDDDLIVENYNAKSNVPDAPWGEQTYTGALNRAMECYGLGGADYYIGIESGLLQRYGNYFEEAWAVVVSGDGVQKIGYSSGLVIPKVIVGKMKNGQTHDEIMAYFDKLLNSPDDNRDTWSRYSGGSISRQISFEEALRNAFIQIVDSKQNLYKY